jgi:pimeloyl-ACP methyl ester carboxylesterase
MLLQSPRRVPSGLRVVWFLFWAAIILAVWAFWLGPFSDLNLSGGLPETVTRTIFGGGIAALLLTYLVARLLPSWLTKSFVDVVRYLDTSPRSYEARRMIRKGIVDLLEGLHDSRRYQRIVLVAHSLGAYIAYDGISYLWARMNKLHDGLGAPDGEENSLNGLKELENAASVLASDPNESHLMEFRDAQRKLWLGLRQQGNPWVITDLVTVGTPMYFADQLYTKNRRQFEARVRRRELPTCPPQAEEAKYNNINATRLWYSWSNRGRRVLYHGAPFAVVRWTNLWFRPRLGLFGDWFGGPLAPLFGGGIRDVELQGNKPWCWTPGYTHTLYFRFPNDVREDSATSQLRRAIDLPSTDWLKETLDAPQPDPRTG